jgi:lipoyl(octanoyl) transferase
MSAPIEWEEIGLCAFERALALQEARWRVRRYGGSDSCLALEHPPTITLGRRATRADLRVPEAALAVQGIACVVTERGGGATYHGPGQLVLYPIVALGPRGFGVAGFVWTLEQMMIEVAAAFGVRADRDPRGRGVWTARGKLGAVGIRVRDGISMHGLALNVATDLAPYRLIAPCGTPDLPVTSLVCEGARAASVADALPVAEYVCACLLGARSGRASGARSGRAAAGEVSA